jgi:hypothetical protein
MKRFFQAYQGRESILEVLIVMVVLVPSVVVPGCRLVDFLAATAVLLTFLCTQCSFDMNEGLVADSEKNERSSYCLSSVIPGEGGDVGCYVCRDWQPTPRCVNGGVRVVSSLASMVAWTAYASATWGRVILR